MVGATSFLVFRPSEYLQRFQHLALTFYKPSRLLRDFREGRRWTHASLVTSGNPVRRDFQRCRFRIFESREFRASAKH